MNNQLIRRIRTLAHKECCNYIDGGCLERRLCTVINPRYPSVQDGAIDCDYFLECVLPLDPELNKAVWAELLRDEDMAPPRERVCALCGQPFLPNSSTHKYCSRCKPLHEQLRSRDKQRNYYQRKQAKEA